MLRLFLGGFLRQKYKREENIGSSIENLRLTDDQNSNVSYLEEFVESGQADIIPTKIERHRGVDVVGIQLRVDLLVDAGLAFGRVVLALSSCGHLLR